MRRPAARASAARDNMNHVDVFRPGAVAEIRATIPEASLRAIDGTVGISWLDFEHDHWLMDGAMSVLGREAAVECWRASVALLVERPLLRNFVDGSRRLFGAKPGQLVKMIPKGWPLAYRDFCSPSFHRTDAAAAEVRFEDVAPQAFESQGYLYCWYAICLGVFDLEKPSSPESSFEIDRSRARAVVTLRWSE
jgi:hypothetical protein